MQAETFILVSYADVQQFVTMMLHFKNILRWESNLCPCCSLNSQIEYLPDMNTGLSKQMPYDTSDLCLPRTASCNVTLKCYMAKHNEQSGLITNYLAGSLLRDCILLLNRCFHTKMYTKLGWKVLLNVKYHQNY